MRLCSPLLICVLPAEAPPPLFGNVLQAPLGGNSGLAGFGGLGAGFGGAGSIRKDAGGIGAGVGGGVDGLDAGNAFGRSFLLGASGGNSGAGLGEGFPVDCSGASNSRDGYVGGLGGLGRRLETSLGGGGGLGVDRSACGLASANAFDRAVSPSASGTTLNRGFEYSQIAAHLLERPSSRSVIECRDACVRNATCAGWEVCAPLGDGCDGCYLVNRGPRRYTDRPGWHAEVLPGREELGWGDESTSAEKMTPDECRKFLLAANGADQGEPFHEPEIMQKYTTCGLKVRDEERPKQIFVGGQHIPTTLVTEFWDPPVGLVAELEAEMFAGSGRQQRPARFAPGGTGVTRQLHETVGTTPHEDHVRQFPRGPHAFILPFYDTNIGHWIKQHGSMNPLQSYEMQSLLAPGDVVIDVGANLGCFTIPFAERVGPHGKVLAFEPFRWMQQFVSANVAVNGLSNVWVLPVGLGLRFSRFEARPPQLRFFSSPGGVKLQGQTDGLKQEEAMQLYDWDAPPELISVVSLDEMLLGRSAELAVLGAPAVDDVRLIKIDVEGMEKDVIAGARQVIRQYMPIIWTENVAYFSSKGQDTSFLQLLNELEYACAQAQNAPNDVVCTDRHGRGHQVN